jgi:hypothetical protein
LLSDLVNRPRAVRFKEFKYRCAQSLIFGLPVLALQYFGPRLGGPEAPRWIGVLQALLSGWILYIAAAGMLLEGLIAPSRRTLPDMLVGVVATLLYLVSLFLVLPVFLTGRPLHHALAFHWMVVLLMFWSLIRTMQLSGVESA